MGAESDHKPTKKFVRKSKHKRAIRRTRFLLAGALNSVEKLPPHVERALDRGPYSRVLDFAHRRVTQNIVADVAMVAIRDFVHVEERDLLARESVVLLEPACERREVARHLAFGRDIDCADPLRERAILSRELEPVDQRRRRRKRLAVDHVLAAHPESESEPDEELWMRGAAGNFSGLLFVEALRELHALLGVEASRVQRAQRARELTHLQKELSREDVQSRLRDFAVANLK